MVTVDCDGSTASVVVGVSVAAGARGHNIVEHSEVDIRVAGERRSSFNSHPMTGINRTAKFQIGQIVQHRLYAFRGVIFDVDPTFNNSEEWWLSIPENVRPRKDQPYYHLFAENAETCYVAYVSEQNLIIDDSGEPILHPDVPEYFGELDGNRYVLNQQAH